MKTAREHTYFADRSYWDGRARLFGGGTEKTPYVQLFLEMAGIQPGETVLDAGCGNGTIALPLAEQGNRVVAFDFSRGMLDCLMQSARTMGVTDNVSALPARWDDDWAQVGIQPCDVAVASRSMASTDLERAIDKLTAYAKRRVCITVAKGRASLYDPILYEAIGRAVPDHDDCRTCLEILDARGAVPQVQTFESARALSFATWQEARKLIERTIAPVSEDERPGLEAYLTQHVHEVVAEGSTCWKCDYTCSVTWAFIAWDVEGFTPPPSSSENSLESTGGALRP